MTNLENKSNQPKKWTRRKVETKFTPPPRKIVPMDPDITACWLSADSPDIYYYTNEWKYEP